MVHDEAGRPLPEALLTREQLKFFIQQLPVAVAMFDKEMRYLAVSRRWMDDYGLTGSVIGQFHYDIFPEMPEHLKEVHRRGLTGEVISADETPFVRQDGEVQWFRWEMRPWGDPGHPSGIIIFTEEITEKIRAKERLKSLAASVQDSENRIQLALQVSRSFTFEWQPDTDKVLRSDSCAGILGLSGDEAIHDSGQNFMERICSEDRARFQRVTQGLSPENNKYEVEYRVVHGDGHKVVLEEIGQGEFDSDGKLVKLIGVATEITQRKCAEEALAKLNEQLEDRINQRTAELAQSLEALRQEHIQRMETINNLREKDQLLIQQSRLAAMGEMVNNIAHQWRQPLNIVGLHLQHLELLHDRGQLSTENLNASIQTAMEQIMHMSSTIDDFRNFFRPNKEKSVFTLQEAANKTTSLIKADMVNKGIEVVMDLQDEGKIFGFFNEFCQALMSIIQNARDVLVERKVTTPWIKIQSRSEADNLLITITDNAGGVAPEAMPRLFEPYFSTKGVQGTGIGLYMAKGIIEAMGGTITAFNTESGAAFKIIVGTA